MYSRKSVVAAYATILFAVSPIWAAEATAPIEAPTSAKVVSLGARIPAGNGAVQINFPGDWFTSADTPLLWHNKDKKTLLRLVVQSDTGRTPLAQPRTPQEQIRLLSNRLEQIGNLGAKAKPAVGQEQTLYLDPTIVSPRKLAGNVENAALVYTQRTISFPAAGSPGAATVVERIQYEFIASLKSVTVTIQASIEGGMIDDALLKAHRNDRTAAAHAIVEREIGEILDSLSITE